MLVSLLSKEEHWAYLVPFSMYNKAAHGQKLGYNDKHGHASVVDLNTLRDWWESLEALIVWVRSQ